MTDNFGWSLVHSASYHGRLGCLQLLIKWGANIDEIDKGGNTPGNAGHASIGKKFHMELFLLMYCTECVIMLCSLDYLAHLAAGEGHVPCLKYLVSTGVNPMHVLGARNDQGETPKDLAQQFYKDTVVEYINGIEWERDHPEEAESKSPSETLAPVCLDVFCGSIKQNA